MKRIGKRELLLAGCCLVCITQALAETIKLDGSEASGGFLTGPLLSMNGYGTGLFLVALICTFLFRQIAAVIAAIASLLCLPLYLFFLAPIPFANIFAPGHPFKGHYSPGLHWNPWTLLDLLTIAFTLYICYRGLLPNSAALITREKPASAGD